MCASQKSFFQPQAFENQDMSHSDNYSSPDPVFLDLSHVFW